MESTQQDLRDLLKGTCSPHKSTPVDVFVEHGKNKQHKEAWVPKVKQNLGYIVCAVVFNNYGEVLMIQESQKEKQKGKWYLPAGKVEAGESFEEALTRITRRESGLKITPSTLLSTECCTGHWYRFTFTGKITGGSIKDKKHSDKHSIMAKWFPVKYVVLQQGIQLRSPDILMLINLGLARTQSITTFSELMPAVKAHRELLYRLVLVQVQDRDGGDALRVLVSKKQDVHHFPTAEINPYDSWVLMAMYRILKDAFGRDDFHTKTNGLLSVEHCGVPSHRNDGICITALVTVMEFQPLATTADYSWMDITDTEMEEALKEKIINENANVSLMDIY